MWLVIWLVGDSTPASVPSVLPFTIDLRPLHVEHLEAPVLLFVHNRDSEKG